MKLQYYLLLFLSVYGLFHMVACKHSPILPGFDDDGMPIDTTEMPVDTVTNPVDTVTTDAAGCETENMSYMADISPVLETYCVGCHSGNAPSGGISLSNYAGVKIVADNGKLVGAINWSAGFLSMPQGGEKLSDCIIDKIKSWIDAGALDN